MCVCVQLGSFSTEKQWEWTNVCHSQESKKIILMLPDIMSDIIRWCVALYHTLGSCVLQCAPKVSKKILCKKLNSATTNSPWDKIAWTTGVSSATTDSPWENYCLDWRRLMCNCTVLGTWLSLSGGVLAWLSDRSEVQTCIWPSWCHCHSLSLASVKSRLVLPFWYQLTRVVPE